MLFDALLKLDTVGVFVILAILVLIVLIIRNTINFFSSANSYSMHKRRLRQLQFSKKQDLSNAEIINRITSPFVSIVSKQTRKSKLDAIDIELKLIDWDKFMKPIQFVVLDYLLKAIALIFLVVLFPVNKMSALIFFSIFFFGLNLYFRGEVNNRREKLLFDFPNFIRITQGYLSAGLTLQVSVAKSIKYVGKEWKPILKQFVETCELKNIDTALCELRDNANLFEIREFVALLRLTLERGGNIRDGFDKQVNTIREIRREIVASKIMKRKMMVTVMQLPMMLCIFSIFILPVVPQMLQVFSSM